MLDQTMNERRPAQRDGAAMKILVADDQPLFLTGVRTVLELDGGFDVVGTTSAGERVLPLVGQLQPNVVLMNMRLPGLDGIDCLDRIMARHPAVKVVMCSVNADPELVQAAFLHGACGYVVKTIESPDLGAAIRQAVDGTAFHAIGPAETAGETPAHAAGLTDRELEIVRAVTRGLSNKAVAEELWITEQTVKFHLTNAYRKLGIRNRTEAARWTVSHGLEGRSLSAVA